MYEIKTNLGNELFLHFSTEEDFFHNKLKFRFQKFANEIKRWKIFPNALKNIN